jgi:hypothetical protein
MTDHLLGVGPALGRVRHDRRPWGETFQPFATGLVPDGMDLDDGPVRGGGQRLVTDAGERGRVGDLVPVEMQYRQDRPSRAGFKNLLLCEAASGRVSVSPSPTMQATIRSG